MQLGSTLKSYFNLMDKWGTWHVLYKLMKDDKEHI